MKLGKGTISGDTYIVPGFKAFTSSGTFIVPLNINQVEVLVVAGGGGGGYGFNINGVTMSGAGGGAGGLVYRKSYNVFSGEEISVVVGAGGAGGTTSSRNGGNGGNSSFGDLVALGGGGGKTFNYSGNDSGFDGGSGSGVSGLYGYGSYTYTPGKALQPGSTSGGYGSDGGGKNTANNRYGSGGGGAGGVGASDATVAGGAGLTYFGVLFARGGNAKTTGGAAESVPVNSGYGGNSGFYSNASIGGSGIVIVRWGGYSRDYV